MPTPRKPLVLLDEASCYRYATRCVRLAFLYGVDRLTAKNHKHRRQWIVDCMKHLAGVFAAALIIKWRRLQHRIIIPNIDPVDTELQSLQMDREYFIAYR
jgi:hypothetical protein